MTPIRMFSLALVGLGLVAGEPSPLSLQEAVRLSLQNNLQVQIARMTRESTVANESIALGTYDWTLAGSFSLSHADSITTATPGKTIPVLYTYDSTTDGRALQAGVNKVFEWGGSFSASYNPVYSNTHGSYSSSGTPIGTFDTSFPYSGSLTATYTQSLLRNFGRETAASTLLVARKGSLIADYTFQKALIALVASTESAYWDVVYAQRNLENKQVSLALAQKQLRENQIRVDVGTMAPLDVVNAEAVVAQREQDIISAEAQLLNAKDALMRMLYPQGERPAELQPADSPNLAHISLDEAGAIKMALSRRVELKGAQLDVESKRILERAAANRLLPQLDAFVSYAGSSDNYAGLASVNSDLFGYKSPGYTVGLQFSMPLANHAAKGTLSQARANTRGSELSLRDQELAISLEVRTAIRNVEAAEKTVKASEKTRIYREKDLDAEQKKFDNGMSTNFLVLSKQNDLDTAKATEVQSQITYAKAVTAFEQAVGNLLEARLPGVKFQ